MTLRAAYFGVRALQRKPGLVMIELSVIPTGDRVASRAIFLGSLAYKLPPMHVLMAIRAALQGMREINHRFRRPAGRHRPVATRASHRLMRSF